MSYRVIVPRVVQKQLNRLPKDVRGRILRRALDLEENPRLRGCVKLKGSESRYRIRVGDYRLLYEVNDRDHTVFLENCAHRREAYRN